MSARIAILLVFGTSVCTPTQMDEPCGKPDKVWIKTHDFSYQHHMLDSDKIEISHLNQILFNGGSRDENELKTYFSNRKPLSSNLLIFDFDAHSDCNVVRKVRKIIEDTGYCGKKNCLIGDPLMEPPALEPLKVEPS